MVQRTLVTPDAGGPEICAFRALKSVSVECGAAAGAGGCEDAVFKEDSEAGPLSGAASHCRAWRDTHTWHARTAHGQVCTHERFYPEPQAHTCAHTLVHTQPQAPPRMRGSQATSAGSACTVTWGEPFPQNTGRPGAGTLEPQPHFLMSPRSLISHTDILPGISPAMSPSLPTFLSTEPQKQFPDSCSLSWDLLLERVP